MNLGIYMNYNKIFMKLSKISIISPKVYMIFLRHFINLEGNLQAAKHIPILINNKITATIRIAKNIMKFCANVKGYTVDLY